MSSEDLIPISDVDQSEYEFITGQKVKPSQKPQETPQKTQETLPFADQLVAKLIQSSSLNFGDDIARDLGATNIAKRLESGASQFDKDSPYLSAGIDIFSPSPFNKLNKAKGIISKALLSGAENALYEAGKGQNIEEKGFRGTIGFGLGTAGGAVGHVISNKLIKSGQSKALKDLNKDFTDIYSDLELEDAKNLLEKSIEYDKPVTLAESLQHQGHFLQPITEDPILNKVDALARNSKLGRKDYEMFLSERRSELSKRLTSDLNEIFDTGTTDFIEAKKIADRAASEHSIVFKEPFNRNMKQSQDIYKAVKIKELFRQAYKETPEISIEGIEKIDELIYKNADFEKAWELAQRNRRNESPYSLKVLHDVKKKLTDDIQDFYKKGANGNFKKSEIKALEPLREELGNILIDESSTFKTAMEKFAEIAKTSKPRAEMQKLVNKRTENSDIIKALLGTPDKQHELERVMDSENYQKLIDRLGLEMRIISGERALRGNSKTAIRQESRNKLVKSLRQLKTDPIELVSRLTQHSRKNADKIEAEMLKLLTSTGQDAIFALDKIRKNPSSKVNNLLADVLFRVSSRSPRLISKTMDRNAD